MAKIIIGLVGHIACGKEAVKKYIVEKYHAKDCRFSTSLRDVVHRLDIPESRENLQKLSTALRTGFGEDILAKVIAFDASKLDSDIVIIDGVRRMADIKYLKELPNFYLVKIIADAKVRYERVRSRNENAGDKDKTFEQFLADEQNETEKEIPVVMDFAKIAIDNNSSLKDLYKQTDSIISKYL